VNHGPPRHYPGNLRLTATFRLSSLPSMLPYTSTTRRQQPGRATDSRTGAELRSRRTYSPRQDHPPLRACSSKAKADTPTLGIRDSSRRPLHTMMSKRTSLPIRGTFHLLPRHQNITSLLGKDNQARTAYIASATSRGASTAVIEIMCYLPVPYPRLYGYQKTRCQEPGTSQEDHARAHGSRK
jgi:hypothetical protein